MIDIGFKLSAEEFSAPALVELAARAEAAGMGFALISDHFHPWTTRQGESPFVWGVLGAIAQATRRITLGTAVTCPTMRIHPALVAQAAATTATMMPGRFVLGLGTGENLNEHVVGAGWPPGDVRLEMLAEAIAVIRQLWQGGVENHRGEYFTVENAQLFSLPKEPPPIMVAASHDGAAELAAHEASAMITTQPSAKLVKHFRENGGGGKPCYVEITACWAADEQAARRTAHRIWPLAALPDPLFTELAQPAHFEAAFEPIGEDLVAANVVCGPDPDAWIEKIREAERAGHSHACVHQIGPDQEGFFRFWEKVLRPRLGAERPRRIIAVADRRRSGRTASGTASRPRKTARPPRS
ncbi:TIGR03557 family F420-dependent LLM class oxidoreductase [Candidatus Binatia bacterium]|nr:TIGR03557 family F420-dependent LLM class oxidoreductase [Candidatus Binatia bacterium]